MEGCLPTRCSESEPLPNPPPGPHLPPHGRRHNLGKAVIMSTTREKGRAPPRCKRSTATMLRTRSPFLPSSFTTCASSWQEAQLRQGSRYEQKTREQGGAARGAPPGCSERDVSSSHPPARHAPPHEHSMRQGGESPLGSRRAAKVFRERSLLLLVPLLRYTGKRASRTLRRSNSAWMSTPGVMHACRF